MYNSTNSILENNEYLSIEYSLKTSIKQFKTYYAKKQFDEAFEQLQFILSIIERCDNPVLITEALICCVKFASIISTIPQSDIFIQSIIASINPDNNPQNLSMCYYLLSIRSLEVKNVTEAIQYAKSAYFHALEIPGDRLFYECNAQLQLVTSLLENDDITHAEKYIEQFNWYIENCKNDADIVFVHSIQASKNFLQQNFEMAVFSMMSLLKKFNESNEVMYTSFLARHFYRIISKHPDSKILFKDLIILCEKIINRQNQFLPMDLNITQHVVIYNSKQFYGRAIEIVDLHVDQTATIVMSKYKLKSGMNLNRLLNIINFETRGNQLIIYPYCDEKFLLITTESFKKQLETNMLSKNNVSLIASVANTPKNNFYEMYNELNLKIISQT
ncbi:hypothetical protein H9635_06450 [Solibacillus sp. A46]|uniref:DNA-binding protein n=1 Tax=Solibacillus faecavium TaxID=2762221 RepID=A0ABR8XWP9_9BACL|nr:hypothetical protein [Solibacillus faecavium]